MYDEFTQGGRSYNHHGSVKYYSPNELTRICRHHTETYAMDEHGKQTEREIVKHHRTHHQHKNDIKEFDRDPIVRKRREKRKHKKEHPEQTQNSDQFRSVTHQHKERRKHIKNNKREGFSELNPQDLQRLMTECKRDVDGASNFSIGYYEVEKSLGGRSVDQIPTRDDSSVNKILKIYDVHQQGGDSSEINKHKQIFSQQYKTPPKTAHLTAEGFHMYPPLVDEENLQYKMKRNREKKSKKEKECRSSDSVIIDRVITPNRYNKPEWYSGDSVIQHRGHRQLIGQHLEQKFLNQEIYPQNFENDCKERRSSHMFRGQDENKEDLSGKYVNEKSTVNKLENKDKKYKLTRKYLRKITKERETKDFRPRTRIIEYEMNKPEQNMDNGNFFKNTHERLSGQKNIEKREKKRKISRKDQYTWYTGDLDGEVKQTAEIQTKEIRDIKNKSRRESTRTKSTNESQSLDRAAKERVVVGDIFTNSNYRGILKPNSTSLYTKHKSESSLSTLHRKNDEFVCLLSESNLEQTARIDAINSNKKCCDVRSSYGLETEKSMTFNSDNMDEFPLNHVGQDLYDDASLQRRLELFQTVLKKDLSVCPRSKNSLCGGISSKIETNTSINKNYEDISVEENFSKGDSTNTDNNCVLHSVAIISKKKRCDNDKTEENSRTELAATGNTYGIIVRGVEPSKKRETFETNKANLSSEKKNNLECKILSVVAITPENLDHKMEDFGAKIMTRTMSTGILHKDIGLQVRNPSSDKRLERLLKYYRVEPLPEMENFSGCSERSSKDRQILKKLIISKLADYLKKLQEDNTGEMIELRTESPRVVKLVLPIDCPSFECSYDINFSKEEFVNETAKESLSDLYINYSDIDDITSEDIQIDDTNDQKHETAIIFDDTAENATKCSEFLKAPTSSRNPIPYKTEIVVNRNKYEINKDVKLLAVGQQFNTNGQYQSNKEFVGTKLLDLKNSSTFIVSENDRSSAHRKCESNFQTSPRESVYIKSLNMATFCKQRRTAMEFIEKNSISSNDFGEKEFSGSKKGSTCHIPNRQVETLITVRTIPERRKFSDYLNSQITPARIDHFLNKEEYISTVLERTHDSNNNCQINLETQGTSDQIMKNSNCINWINQSTPNKSGFGEMNHEISHFKQALENSAVKNDGCRKERTFSQNDINLTVGKGYENDANMDISFNGISNILHDKREDIVVNQDNTFFLLRPTVPPSDEPVVSLVHKVVENAELENSITSQIPRKAPFEKICPEMSEYKNTLEEKQYIAKEQMICDETKFDQCLQKCLNWEIRDSSRTMISGQGKCTQKGSQIPKRSYIPIAKKNLSKCSSVQVRSSSVGRDINTSMLLTKSYRKPLGQSSYERRKLYDTSIRKNGKRRSLSESSGTTNKNPLIYEVRYFNIHNQRVPSLINHLYENNDNSDDNHNRYSESLNQMNNRISIDSLFSTPPKNSECNLNSIQTENDFELNQLNENTISNHYLDGRQSVDYCNQEGYTIPPCDFPVKYIHESRKMKMTSQKENSNRNLDSKRKKICNQTSNIAINSSVEYHDGKINLIPHRGNFEVSSQNREMYKHSTRCDDESEICQNMTKLSIEKPNNKEVILFFGNQNSFSAKKQSSENFDQKSSVSSSAEGEISDNPESVDVNEILSESTLVNRRNHSSSTSTESKETLKAVGAQEIVEHSIIDSGYLTKEADINYSKTTLDGGTKLNAGKFSLNKSNIEVCGLVKSKLSRWNQGDLLRLKLQLLFPNVYDDFELVEAAQNTELIEFYLESANEKLIGAVETISRKREMSVKSRSVISLPSVQTISNEHGKFTSIGDAPSDSCFKMNKGGFYNYQKFIAQNNDHYSSDILSKIKCDDEGGRETPEDEYPRSETSSMKSSSLYSVKSSSSVRKSIIELFKLKSCKSIPSNCKVTSVQGEAIQQERKENIHISEEQFSNHFHQIMSLECQKFAKKVKNESLLKENTREIEEFKELPLDFILKNRNISLKNRIDLESLPSLMETDDVNNDGINEFAQDNFCGTYELANSKIFVGESATKIGSEIKENKSSLNNDSQLNLNQLPGKIILPSDFSETSNISNGLFKSSNISPKTPISEIMPLGKSTKLPEKEYFDNLLTFYDHETEFTTKLIRDNEFFVSLLEKIREDDSFNIIYQNDIQKKMKKEKKPGILARLFRKKKKSNETVITSPSISKSLEFAKSLSVENNSVNRESCYSFFKDVDDLEKEGESEAATAKAEVLRKLAYKAKSHLEPMAKATLSNQHINDRIKLAGFLNFLNMIERGDIARMNNVNTNKSIVEEKLREHVAQLFDKVYRIANREVIQRNMILDDKKIDLLKFLVTKYHTGMDVHINILAIYIGRNLILSRSQLEDAILCLMKLNTQDVNLEDFEKNCGINNKLQ